MQITWGSQDANGVLFAIGEYILGAPFAQLGPQVRKAEVGEIISCSSRSRTIELLHAIAGWRSFSPRRIDCQIVVCKCVYCEVICGIYLRFRCSTSEVGPPAY